MKAMKDLKTKVNPRPFMVIGFTLDDYYRWCEKNGYRPYKISAKKEFFKRYNNFIIVKRNGKTLEDGVEF